MVQPATLLQETYIYDAIRTPRARANEKGGFNGMRPFDLLEQLYRALEQRTGLDPSNVNDIILGCVTQTGDQAANIAKTSSMYAGWPSEVPGMTVSRFCSSGLDAVNLAAMKVMTGTDDLLVAGGVEMMSVAPMMSDKASAFVDIELATKLGMFMMGSGADLIASQYGVSREQADAVALQSQQRSASARELGYFSSIVPIKNEVTGSSVEHDECIRPQTSLATLAELEPSFAKLGAKGIDAMYLSDFPELKEILHVHTAGNSPAMADGAAALLIGNAEAGKALSAKPRARIAAMKSVNDDKRTVLGGCVAAAQSIMKANGFVSADIDLFEIHEAFAATMIKCKQDLGIDDDKLNVNGGCIALGHPLGATGAIMAGVLLDELERRDLQRGLVSASGAAGVGTALIIERC